MPRKDLNIKYDDRFILSRIHYLRMVDHFGSNWAERNAFTNDRWPSSDADWRQTPHGAPWDSNVMMANWHINFAEKLQSEGILND